jgi:cell shape-determining protein MreC
MQSTRITPIKLYVYFFVIGLVCVVISVFFKKHISSLKLKAMSIYGTIHDLYRPHAKKQKGYAMQDDSSSKMLTYISGEYMKLQQEHLTLMRKYDSLLETKNSLRDQITRIIASDVIVPTDGSVLANSILVRAGNESGVSEGDMAVWGDFLVGKVVEVGGKTSRVRLITDSRFRVRACVYMDDKSSCSGLLVGGVDRHCELLWIMSSLPVKKGMTVFAQTELKSRVVSFIVGKISDVNSGYGLYHKIKVEPAIEAESLNTLFIVK